MNEVKKFDHRVFGELRVVIIEGANYFVAKEVSDLLGYASPSKAYKHCRGLLSLNSSYMEGIKIEGVHPASKLITEGDVYTLIIKSTKKESQIFKDWIMSTVLPEVCAEGADIEYQDCRGLPDKFTVGVHSTLLTAGNSLITEISTLEEDKLDKLSKLEKINDTIMALDLATSGESGLPYFEVSPKHKIAGYTTEFINKLSTPQTPVTTKGKVYICSFDNGRLKVGMSTKSAYDRIQSHIKTMAITCAAPQSQYISDYITNAHDMEKLMIKFAKDNSSFSCGEWTNCSFELVKIFTIDALAGNYTKTASNLGLSDFRH